MSKEHAECKQGRKNRLHVVSCFATRKPRQHWLRDTCANARINGFKCQASMNEEGQAHTDPPHSNQTRKAPIIQYADAPEQSENASVTVTNGHVSLACMHCNNTQVLRAFQSHSRLSLKLPHDVQEITVHSRLIAEFLLHFLQVTQRVFHHRLNLGGWRCPGNTTPRQNWQHCNEQFTRLHCGASQLAGRRRRRTVSLLTETAASSVADHLRATVLVNVHACSWLQARTHATKGEQ